jgi:hypothetical protein
MSDTTQDPGSTRDNGWSVRSYRADGYHLTVRDPNASGPAAVEAPTSHTVLGVQIDARMVRMPVGANFGPYCWQDPTHGYGFVVDARGTRELVQVDGSQGDDITVLATAGGAPVAAARTVRLLVTCSISPTLGKGGVTVKGYVDGVKALEARGRIPLSEFRWTGFALHTEASVPAECVVSRFSRLGANDIPS